MNLNIDLSNVEKQNQDIHYENNEELETTEIKSSSRKFNLALNLEEVSEIEEQKEVVSEFTLEEEYIDRIVAAIGAGLATESVVNARILESANALIQEARAMTKTVVRGGKLVQKNICPEGFKVSKSGMCERMSSRDIIAYRKRAMKAAKTRMRRRPTAASAKMRNRSLLVRGKTSDAKLNRIVPAAASTQVK